MGCSDSPLTGWITSISFLSEIIAVLPSLYTDVFANSILMLVLFAFKGLHEYGLLWSKDKVEWRFDGRIVRTVTDPSIIPFQPMQLRLHTRSGYCDHMKTGDAFTATFRSFSYTPLRPVPPPPPPPSPSPSPPSPSPSPHPGPAAQCAAAGGILNPKGGKHANICCAKSCGSCGGSHCGDKPGGSHDCCSNQIEEDGRKCATMPAPCLTNAAAFVAAGV